MNFSIPSLQINLLSSKVNSFFENAASALSSLWNKASEAVSQTVKNAFEREVAHTHVTPKLEWISQALWNSEKAALIEKARQKRAAIEAEIDAKIIKKEISSPEPLLNPTTPSGVLLIKRHIIRLGEGSIDPPQITMAGLAYMFTNDDTWSDLPAGDMDPSSVPLSSSNPTLPAPLLRLDDGPLPDIDIGPDGMMTFVDTDTGDSSGIRKIVLQELQEPDNAIAYGETPQTSSPVLGTVLPFRRAG